MRPRDWFGVGIRLLGAWWFVQGANLAIAFLYYRLGLDDSPFTGSRSESDASPHGYLLYAAGYWAPACYALFGAEHLTRWVYHENEPETAAPLIADNEPKDKIEGPGVVLDS